MNSAISTSLALVSFAGLLTASGLAWAATAAPASAVASAATGTTTGAGAKAMANERELDTGLTDAEVKAFLKEIKAASAAKDAPAMARLVKFPVRLNGRKKIRSYRRLVARFPEVFNDNVTQAIEKQRYETLSSNYQGVTIGEGQIWFKLVCRTEECVAKAPRIIAINNE